MTITAGDLDSSAFNIQGIGFATGLAGALIGCRDSAADNFNIDTGGVYGPANGVVVFNTHSDPGDPNECLYTGCMDQNSPSFFSTVYNGNTYYATLHQYNSFTAGTCDYEGCNDPLAYNYNVTCTGYDLTPLGLSITITNNNCCNYPQSWDCDTVNGNCTTVSGGTGTYVVCNDFYDPTAPANTPAGCYATPIDAMAAACTSGNCPSCGSSTVNGCTDDCAPNYDPLATCDDGSCDPVIYGCMDNGSMTAGQVNSNGNSIWPSTACLGATCTAYDSYDSTWNYIDPSTGTQLNTNLGNDIAANNYDNTATHMDCSCEYHGCTDPQAINYESFHTHEDGSCIYAGCTDPIALNYSTFNHPNPILYDALGNIITTWYTNPIAATIDDGSCIILQCNDIATPNVKPWDGAIISETSIPDPAFEQALESRNEVGPNGKPLTSQMGSNVMLRNDFMYLGHAGSWDDSVPPLAAPGNVTGLDCGKSTTFGNNHLNVWDFGNGVLGDCTSTPFLTFLTWDGAGGFTYNGSVCTQGFANAAGPFDAVVFGNPQTPFAPGYIDGFYLNTFVAGTLSYDRSDIITPIGQDIYDISGIQDMALNPSFKRLVIHNQHISDFIHSEPDPASSYHQLDMLETLFENALNFDFLSLKSCRLGIGAGHQTLDLQKWPQCVGVELVDLGYDEININHINNPDASIVQIVNNANYSNNLGNSHPRNKNMSARGQFNQGSQGIAMMYKHMTFFDFSSPSVIKPATGKIGSDSSTDSDQSFHTSFSGNGYDQNSMPTALKNDMYSSSSFDNLDFSNPNRYLIGEHFPPQPPGFTGWDPSTGFTGAAATNFVPQKKLAPIIDSGQSYGNRDGTVYLPDTRRGQIAAFENQTSYITGYRKFYNASPNSRMFHYQGNIIGLPLWVFSNTSIPPGGHYNGYAWIKRPSNAQLGNSSFHNTTVMSQGYGVGFFYPYLPQNFDPWVKIDAELTPGKLMDRPNLHRNIQSSLVLINLPNLRHVWLGPDWDPKYAMNEFNCMPTVSAGYDPKNKHSRGFSIKGCGNGQTVYVHTSGRALEFKKRYGTNDTTAVDPNLTHGWTGQPQSVWSQTGEDFFLDYFDSNVVFVD